MPDTLQVSPVFVCYGSSYTTYTNQHLFYFAPNPPNSTKKGDAGSNARRKIFGVSTALPNIVQFAVMLFLT